LLGQWPYRCEDCGTNFLLKKRYVKAKSERSADGEASSRHSSRQMHAYGTRGGDAINVRHGAAVRDLSSLGN
jgi:hypothetical protein